jgi:pimeloyl-ACP methyl ester carboxylesterase
MTRRPAIPTLDPSLDPALDPAVDPVASATPTPPRVRWFRAGPAADDAPDAPVFVLVHGVGLSHRSFSRLAPLLAEHGSVLAVDLPGFGRTPGPHRRVDVDEMAEALLPRLDAVPHGADRLVVIGHSLGVEVAVELALRRPGLVRGVVLVGPVVDPAAASVFGQARRLLLDVFGEPPLTGAMVTRDYARGGLLSYAAGVVSMLRYETADRIREVTRPVLVLRGAHDPVAPADWVHELVDLVADGRAAEVPGAVHNVVHSHPDEVARQVLAFVAGLPEARVE